MDISADGAKLVVGKPAGAFTNQGNETKLYLVIVFFTAIHLHFVLFFVSFVSKTKQRSFP